MKINLYPDIHAEDLIGKYAWNPTWKNGGKIVFVDGGKVILDNTEIYTTCTGTCCMDSLVINGFDVYDTEEEIDKTKAREYRG